MRKRKTYKLITLALVLSLIMPIASPLQSEAASQSSQRIFQSTMEFANAFDEFGINNRLLIELTNLDRREDSFYQIPTPFSSRTHMTSEELWGSDQMKFDPYIRTCLVSL